MAHGGQEQGFSLAGFVGRTTCLLHQVGVIHMPGDVVETAEHYVFAFVTGEGETGLKMTSRNFELYLAQLVFTIIALQQGNEFRCPLPLLRPLIFQ